MSFSNLNPEFAGLGVITPNPPQILSLYAQMPFGKHKGETVAHLIEDETQYMRWFVDNVDKYVLSPEACNALRDAEASADDMDIDSGYRQLNFDDDIPW